MNEFGHPSDREQRSLATKTLLESMYDHVDDPHFEMQLQDSLFEAQKKAANEEAIRTDDQFHNIFRYSSDFENDRTIAIVRFEQKLAEARKEKAVILFDIPAIERQKGSPCSRYDLIPTFDAAIAKVTANTEPAEIDDNQEKHPLYRLDTYTGGGEESLQWFFEDLREFERQQVNNNAGLHVALIYPNERNDEMDRLLFELPHQLSKLQRTDYSILIDREVLRDVTVNSWMSPWINVYSPTTDLGVMTAERLADTIAKLRTALDTQEESSVRYIVAGFRSGKTTAVKKLLEERFDGVTYIDGMLPLNEQPEALNGKVIFVDEAATISPENLHVIKKRADENKSVLIMLCPEEAAKESVASVLR